MKIIITILLFSMTAFAQTQPRENVKQSYYRFKDQATTGIEPTHVSTTETGDFYLTVIATHQGEKKTPTTKLSIMFAIVSYTEDWYFLKSELILRAIVDNERINYGKMERIRSDVVGRRVSEGVALDMTIPQLEKIANAKSVEMQVGRLECKLTQAQLADIRYLLTLIK